ncbi:diaminobutyrate--2-oxoglutarate transaminase [Roseovarius sp. A21]|uniref:Diaminobutyrate--2-oxoglutarate transaminase n=1 Tax=Roseovarius bejariae TaxID=2576383 RepID=A0A844CYB6_9RHOB|nr:diaminobutyrate--2-oxoglutarate transaminase [Roseovarius bejariae]MRU17099.1 diaminobutyrate--2-oxoglutarate transaminase [Roseovarius bejariae]
MTLESEVRSYCRTFDVEFSTGRGGTMTTTDGRHYRDFLACCGSLNYGHNHPVLKQALTSHIADDGLAMSLDLKSDRKRDFLTAFETHILKPRRLDYVVQLPGPTGANAIEAAIKLARKVTGRNEVIAFTNGFHGCTLGALALTGSGHHRGQSGTLLSGVTRAPYDGYYGPDICTAEMLDKMLSDPSGGLEAPAAIVLEAIQGEGGLNMATPRWTRRIAEIARKHGALLIVDDIQAGCGRSGDFFSFEALRITPDIVTLAKSLSGFGLPMSMVLFRREFDLWLPGEHNGTFRGNSHAFVTATAALDHFWADLGFAKTVKENALFIAGRLKRLAETHGLSTRGRGFMQGLRFDDPVAARRVQLACFKAGLILETCGPHDEVIKLLPALTLTRDELAEGIDILADALATTLSKTEEPA